jgi:hypothetical protein
MWCRPREAIAAGPAAAVPTAGARVDLTAVKASASSGVLRMRDIPFSQIRPVPWLGDEKPGAR